MHDSEVLYMIFEANFIKSIYELWVVGHEYHDCHLVRFVHLAAVLITSLIIGGGCQE